MNHLLQVGKNIHETIHEDPIQAFCWGHVPMSTSDSVDDQFYEV